MPLPYTCAAALVVAGLVPSGPAGAARQAQRVEANNSAFRIVVTAEGDAVSARVVAAADGRTVADGPVMYAAAHAGAAPGSSSDGLTGVELGAARGRVTIRGHIGGLAVEHAFLLPASRDHMVERIVLRNRGRRPVALSQLEVGLTLPVAGPDGATLPAASADRWVAVPFRHRATQARGDVQDFGVTDLLARPGWTIYAQNDLVPQDTPARHRPSEGWAWVRGGHAVGVYAFCQEHLRYSVLSAWPSDQGARIRLGGMRMVESEPSALAAIGPGKSVDLGEVRYVCVPGGYTEAAYAFRAMLDEKGCRFPARYDAPVHWEQLYDMWDAWFERPNRYTLAALREEARKGVAYSCEALYLDPGWDDAFGTFRWGPWLGSPTDFARELKERYGLQLALHCPLATWATNPAMPMGPFGAGAWPAAARRKLPDIEAIGRAPAVRSGRRNLALLPGATASASSVYDEGRMPIHQVPHLVDGWYGNQASWIAAAMPAWAEVDLGAEHTVSEVRLGNDRLAHYIDRAATRLRILGSVSAAGDGAWRELAQAAGLRLTGEAAFAFEPTRVRRIRVEVLDSDGGMPRLDEVEVYEAAAISGDAATAYERTARRGPKPPAPVAGGAEVCLGSKQYLDEAERRLTALCQAGATFLMYDGNWYPGPCEDRGHGHPVPYTWEAHIRGNLDLARRIHRKHPGVYIEMHDMLAGGHTARPTPVYYKYGLPGSYDDNWGLELMWDPMADLKDGRAAALYYYNLACNVPMYLHINLKTDNTECVVLWWYASTCRHLGIGGTHADPNVVAAQQSAMRTYRRLASLYKRGEFYGFGEEVHVHTLPAENRMAVNVFNLSDRTRSVIAAIPLSQVGLQQGQWTSTEPWAVERDGAVHVRLEMPPWSARVTEVKRAAVSK